MAAKVWRGCSAPSVTSLRVRSIGASASRPRAPAQCTTRVPGSSPGAIAAATSSMAASGVAITTRDAPRPRSPGAHGAQPSRATAARVDAASTERPVTPAARHPAATSASASEDPARPGPASAKLRTGTGFTNGLSLQPTGVPVSGLTGPAMLGRWNALRSSRAAPRRGYPRSARGASTKSRSRQRGWGICEVGFVDRLIAEQHDVDIERPRPPALLPHPFGLGLERLPDGEERLRRQRRCRRRPPR